MKITRIGLSCITVIVIGLYTLITCLLFEKDGKFWLLFAVTIVYMISYFILNFFVFNKKDYLLLKLPASMISLFFVGVQVLLSIILMAIKGIGTKFLIVVEAILAAVYLIFLIAALFAESTIVSAEEYQQKKIMFIRQLSAQIAGCIDVAPPDALTTLSALQEKISLSDPMSDERLGFLEHDIASRVAHLREAIGKMNREEREAYCADIERLLNERNRMCMIYK